MTFKGILTRPRAAALATVMAAGLGALAMAAAEHASNANPPATFRYASPDESVSRNTFAPVVKKVLPAVVNVASSKMVKNPMGMTPGNMEPFFRQFFGGEEAPFGSNGRGQAAPQQLEQGQGSGVIVSPEGYILTNNHVVDGATILRVTLSDKREFKARVVGTDPKTDLAVLKIDAANLPTVVIGDSDKIQVGDFALAIGNPFGLGGTVTMGIVSATGRSNLGIEDYEDFIQTDAPINPGNSGGALVNERGDLIGINTAILSGSQGNQGIGFAIPVSVARNVTDQILRNGKVTRAYLGVMSEVVTPALAKAFHQKEPAGALISEVKQASPAAHAGLEKGDIILAVNGKLAGLFAIADPVKETTPAALHALDGGFFVQGVGEDDERNVRCLPFENFECVECVKADQVIIRDDEVGLETLQRADEGVAVADAKEFAGELSAVQLVLKQLEINFGIFADENARGHWL